MSKIYLVDLESVETRYTSQWKYHLPKMLSENTECEVVIIDGPEDIAACTTPGAFLNFSGTNVYKSVQVEKISNLFSENKVNKGDHFLFADAWHPGIINLKYMSSLLNVPIKIHALWHAGSYDPQDFLGRLIGDEPWVRNFEKSLFHAIDHNYFASNFHIEMFVRTLIQESSIKDLLTSKKIVQTGWPMEYIVDEIKPGEKENIILFPHRMAPEKQPNLVKQLAEEMPEYEFIFCQEQNLTKQEYHDYLSRAKMVISFNLQETLGISCFEIMAAGGIPFVPDNLSYAEMYHKPFKFDGTYIKDEKSFQENKDELKEGTRYFMENFDTLFVQNSLKRNFRYLKSEYFSGRNLYRNIMEG